MIFDTEEIGKDELQKLLEQCTDEQVLTFDRLYGPVDDIPIERINEAIRLCERTIAKNKKK